MKKIYIIDAKRTAIGSFLGSLSTIEAPKLGAEIIRALLESTKIDAKLIDEVIMGQVLTGGSGQNPARQASIYANIPKETPSVTINQVCGSGLKAVSLAASSIISGDADIIIAGGQENMSLAMHAGYMRIGSKFGNKSLKDLMVLDGLTDAFSSLHMGITAENIADKFKITRKVQDELSLKSQQNAIKAQTSGKFKDEIHPIEIHSKKGSVIFDQDEGIKGDTSLEQLSKLQPAFKKDGTVTAGNASTINDGAAAFLIASEDAVKKHNLKPMARIVSYASCGVDPSIMGTGPVPASKKALKKAGWSVKDLDIIEANEAFASQAEYVNKEMQWDIKKVNINGGAIALGHPIGASGARVLTTLLYNLVNEKKQRGLATLCIGGGMGIAMCIERE